MIKRADPSDLEELMTWREMVLREVFSIPEGKNISGLLAVNREYYRNALDQGNHIACFACIDGKTVGCGGLCLYQEMPSPDNENGRCAYLMNIYTLPDMRRHGIGKAIVEWLIRAAIGREAGKIYLEASDKAYPLYRELGFREMDGYLKYTK